MYIFEFCRDKIKKAIKVKDTYSLVMDKVNTNNALKKQAAEASFENNMHRGE